MLCTRIVTQDGFTACLIFYYMCCSSETWGRGGHEGKKDHQPIPDAWGPIRCCLIQGTKVDMVRVLKSIFCIFVSAILVPWWD